MTMEHGLRKSVIAMKEKRVFHVSRLSASVGLFVPVFCLVFLLFCLLSASPPTFSFLPKLSPSRFGLGSRSRVRLVRPSASLRDLPFVILRHRKDGQHFFLTSFGKMKLQWNRIEDAV